MTTTDETATSPAPSSGEAFRAALHERWAARGHCIDTRPWLALPEVDRDDLDAAAEFAIYASGLPALAAELIAAIERHGCYDATPADERQLEEWRQRARLTASPAAAGDAPSQPPVIVATDTEMYGLVLRWYTDMAAAVDRMDVLSVSRSGILGKPGVVPEAWLADAKRAQRLLKAGQVDEARALATHEHDAPLGGNLVAVSR